MFVAPVAMALPKRPIQQPMPVALAPESLAGSLKTDRLMLRFGEFRGIPLPKTREEQASEGVKRLLAAILDRSKLNGNGEWGGLYPMGIAAHFGLTSAVDSLWLLGALPNQPNANFLKTAMLSEHEDTAVRLVALGANLVSPGFNALSFAVEKDMPKLVEAVLARAEFVPEIFLPDATGRTPLIGTARLLTDITPEKAKARVEMAKAILRAAPATIKLSEDSPAVPYVDVQDEQGWSALMLAAGNANAPQAVELAKVLGGAGANPRLRTKYQHETALDKALKVAHEYGNEVMDKIHKPMIDFLTEMMITHDRRSSRSGLLENAIDRPVS